MQNKDSIKNILLIGIGLCLVCAAVISIIAVGLKELQKSNAILDQQKKIVAAADLKSFYGTTEAAFDSIEEIIIDIAFRKILILKLFSFIFDLLLVNLKIK